MNEMDLIKDFCAEQVPPGPERLAAARARVVAGIQGAAPSRPAHSSPRRALRAMLTRPGLVISGGIAAAAVGVIMVGVVAAVGPARHSGGVPGPVTCNANLYPLDCPGSGMAEKTTVAGAQAAVGFPVPVPGTAAASPANLTQAWVSNTRHIPRKERQAALVFDKGKVDILMHRATYQSALSYFRAFVAQKKKNGAPNAAIGQVNGRPALVIPPPPNRSDVDFWRNGVFIAISSSTYGTDTLLGIARSMR